MLATIEREAYAYVFALKKFPNFIFACNPLLYLWECAPKSARLIGGLWD